MATKKKAGLVSCPHCKAELALQPHPTKEGRVIAVCSCGGFSRPVVETNAVEPTKESLDNGST